MRHRSLYVTFLTASAFLLLTILVVGGWIDATDRIALSVFHRYIGEADPNEHIWSRDIMRDVTALGGYPALLLVTIGTFIALFQSGRRREACLLALAALGNQASIEIVKSLVNRTRPEYGLEMALSLPRGFPSGHTAETTAIFGTIAVLVAAPGTSYELRVLSFGAAILVSFGLGISRLYLNVHWPSDILAGWLLGGAWVAFAWMLLQTSVACPPSMPAIPVKR